MMLQVIVVFDQHTTFLAVVIIDLGHFHGGTKAIVQNAKQPNNESNDI